MRKHLFIVIVALAGCSDHPYDPDAPAIDPNAPKVHITTPLRGTVAGDVKKVTVTGTATDDTAVTSVVVNDVPAALAADGTWTVDIPVVPGTNLIHAVAKDAQDNTGKESRAVVAGPQQDLAQHVPNAITATLSAQTFDAIGRGAGTYIKTADLEALIAPMNPVIHAGDPTGPDCLYGQAHITSMHVGDADITLAPQTGGLFMDAELSNVQIGMHLQYAVSCLDGSRDITVGASHLSVSGNLTVGLLGHDFDIHLVNPNVTITGFDLNLGGVPGTIVDLLHIDTALGPVLGWATEKFVAPMLNKSLAGLNDVRTITVLNKQFDIDVKPSKLQFSSAGAIVELDTSLRAHGDSGKFVYVPNTVPAMDLSHGFQLAVADDAANQAATSLWSAKALDETIKLTGNGSYGDVGKLYDSVEIEAKAPPFVDASDAQKGLVLTVGDLMATFRNGASVATQVAINAQVALKVATGPDGKMRFDVGQPTVYVDILDENIEGANQLSNADFEAITSFALARVVVVGSAAVGTIPLPAAGGVGVTDLTINSQTGYLVVAGNVQ